MNWLKKFAGKHLNNDNNNADSKEKRRITAGNGTNKLKSDKNFNLLVLDSFYFF